MRGVTKALVLLLWCACDQLPRSSEIATDTQQYPVLVVSQKAAKSLGWYSLDGDLLHEVRVSDHPHEFVASPDRSRLYMTDNGVMQIENAGAGGNKVSIIDLDARERIGEVDLGDWRRPHGIDLCRDGTLLVTTENPDQLLVINVERQEIEQEFPTGGQTPHIVRCSSDSRTAFVSNSRSRTVARIDLQSGRRDLIETGDRPEGSALSDDGAKLFVAHRDGDKIVVIDTASWRVLGEIATVGSPVRCGLTNSGRTVAYGLYSGAIGFADVGTMEEVGRLDLDGPAVSLEVHDNETVITCAQSSDLCYLVSVGERRILREIKVRDGAGPDPALLINPGGKLDSSVQSMLALK